MYIFMFKSMKIQLFVLNAQNLYPSFSAFNVMHLPSAVKTSYGLSIVHFPNRNFLMASKYSCNERADTLSYVYCVFLIRFSFSKRPVSAFPACSSFNRIELNWSSPNSKFGQLKSEIANPLGKFNRTYFSSSFSFFSFFVGTIVKIVIKRIEWE